VEIQPTARNNWLQVFILGVSILLVAIAAGNFMLFSQSLTTSSLGIELEGILTAAGALLALPVGLLSIWICAPCLKQRAASIGRGLSIAGLTCGLIGAVTGLIWWGALLFLLSGGFR
jgi:hypothetical protein